MDHRTGTFDRWWALAVLRSAAGSTERRKGEVPIRADTLVAFVVFAGGLTLFTPLVLRFWKHDITGLDRPRRWWVFGGEAWRAFVRITPIAVVGGWLLVAAGVLMLTTPAGQRTPLAPPLAAALLLLFVLLATIWFWNQPKFLVPPHLRHEAGTLSGLLRSKPRRRR
jgi:hypothetical protein